MIDPAAPLVLNLLGPFEARVSGSPLPRLYSQKERWLLVLLVLRYPREIERLWLAGALWPDSSESQALSYLRKSLTHLRHALGLEAHRLLSPSRHTLAINLTHAEVDLVAFDQATALGDTPSLERAVSLYRGLVLEGCSEEWIMPERGVREQAYLKALETLADRALAQSDFAAATDYLRRIVQTDPLRESAHRSLMASLAKAGNFADATHVYRQLRSFLHREMNVEPSPETARFYQLLREEAQQEARVPRPALPTLFPPSPSQLPRPPCPLTPLIGRESEIVELRGHLAASRLVTLTGPGGVGKTRLALQVAEEAGKEALDGAAFVYLAPLSDPALVAQAVTSALGVREAPGISLLKTVTETLYPRSLLLVLDNCEHLVETCAELAEALLAACPRLRILATSRESLGVSGEVSYRVPPLSLPDETTAFNGLPEALLERSGALRLFVDRAKAARPGLNLCGGALGVATEICRRLDGLPLALELAAVQAKALSLDQIATRLHDRFRLLSRGSRTASPRHRTLQAAIDWSHDLLSDPERRLFRRLSVFAGGMTLEAAESVCSGEDNREGEVLDLVATLVDQSLVLYDPDDGPGRYRLLETLRQYAKERLDENGETSAISDRRQDYYLRMAEEGEPGSPFIKGTGWLGKISADEDNLRVALTYAQAKGECTALLRLVGLLGQFWVRKCHLTEGRHWMETALRLNPDGSPELRIRSLISLAFLYLYQWDQSRMAEVCRESLTLSRQIESEADIALSLGLSAFVAHIDGDMDRSRALAEESICLARRVNNRGGLHFALHVLSLAELAQGEYLQAEAHQRESLEHARFVGDDLGIAYVLGALGQIDEAVGRYDEALDRYEQSLSLFVNMGEKRGAGMTLNGIARVRLASGRYEEAVEIFGATQALWESVRGPHSAQEPVKNPHEPTEINALEFLKSCLPTEVYAEAWRRGREYPLERFTKNLWK